MRKMIIMPALFCLICSMQLDASSCVNIFCTSLPHNGELLASYILKVLKLVVSDLHSSYVCSQCYNLFEMLEQAQWNVTNIRCEILKVYHTRMKEKTTMAIVGDGIDSLQKDDQDEHFVQHNTSIHNTFKESKTTGSLNLCSNKLNENIKDTRSKSKCLYENLNILYNDQSTKEDLMNIMQVNEPNNPRCNGYEQSISVNMINIISNKTNSNDCNIGQLNNDKRKHLKVKESFKTSDINDALCNFSGLPHDSLGTHNDIAVPTGSASNGPNKKYANYSQKISSLNNKDKCKVKGKEENETVEETNENLKHITGNTFYECNSFENVHREENLDLLEPSWKPGETSRCNSKTFKHSCPTCGKKWRTSTELKTHIKSHSTLRPYMCEKCGQAYKHKHALEIHVGMHNGINPFQCSFCDKCFTQKGALMRHLPMHTGEMPYQCELCGKRFVHHTSYNMHALSHTGKKSYQCHVCDLSLLSTSHLKRHMRVHTGEKPYCCTLCGKRFAERYNLFAHQKIHDPAQITLRETKKMHYVCDQCNLQFNRKQKLNDHLKCHHKSNKEEVTKKSSGQVLEVPSETDELFKPFTVQDDIEGNIKREEVENGVVHQTRPEINDIRLHNVDNQTKVILCQNSLSGTDASSLAITFNDPTVSLEDSHYDSNLQVIIEPSTISHLRSNSTIDKSL